MNRLLSGFLIALPVVWAGATWGISNKTEAVFDDMLSSSNEKLAQKFPFLTMEKKSYEKGFTSSQAQSIVKLNTALFGENEEEVSLTLNHRIEHGPVMSTTKGIKTGASYVTTTLETSDLPAELTEVMAVLLDSDEPFFTGVKTGISGEVVVDIEIGSFSYDQSKRTKLEALEINLGDELENLSFKGDRLINKRELFRSDQYDRLNKSIVKKMYRTYLSDGGYVNYETVKPNNELYFTEI